jgi:phosphatidylglycerophosphate synthase
MTDTSDVKQANRIQTSFINGIEKKALVWLAHRQPKWVTSDFLTCIGVIGAFLVGLGFYLTNYSINWLWLSSFGLVVNWYGDSLDGTLARVRNCQRPIYGYYLDHTIDCINEGFMFIGAGLSPFVHLDLTLIVFVLYLFMTVNVSINAHLRGEFRLTYAKLGPTEFRLLFIIVNTLLICFPSLASYSREVHILGYTSIFTTLDFVVSGTIVLLLLIYIFSIIFDARYYSKIDPLKKDK